MMLIVLRQWLISTTNESKCLRYVASKKLLRSIFTGLGSHVKIVPVIKATQKIIFSDDVIRCSSVVIKLSDILGLFTIFN